MPIFDTYCRGYTLAVVEVIERDELSRGLAESLSVTFRFSMPDSLLAISGGDWAKLGLSGPKRAGSCQYLCVAGLMARPSCSRGGDSRLPCISLFSRTIM